MMMALGFLPANIIRSVFDDLSADLSTTLTMFHCIWIDNAVWPLSTWSVFRQPIHTNNCEG